MKLVAFDDCFVRRVSELAVNVVFPCGQEVWIPRSQLTAEGHADILKGADVGDEGTLVIPEWLAKEKDLL